MNQILTRASTLLKFTLDLNIEQIAKIISGLVIIVIISMDLGVEYSKNEKQIYTSFIFQVIAILAVAYTLTQDLNMSILLLIIWAVIKYSNRISINNRLNIEARIVNA
jgi:hypothetical protein